MLRSSSAAALCALAAIVTLAAVVWGSSGAETALLRTRLREDVTSPRVRSQFLHKFNAAKSHVRAGKKGSKKGSSMLFDPLSGFKGGEGKVKGKKQLTAAQKAAIAAKMKALREKILGDFSSNTKFGKRVDC